MKREVVGYLEDGTAVEKLSIASRALQASFLTYGATLQELKLRGIAHSLVLGFSNLNGYLDFPAAFGATVGRFANRIANASFELDGQHYHLDRNLWGRHCLHGGSKGLGVSNWTIKAHEEASILFELRQPDGHMGFPGSLEVNARFSLLDFGVLDIVYTAISDAPTPCNLAHHSYFNLSGEKDILGHELEIDAAQYLPWNSDLMPSGEIAPVCGTLFDMRKSRTLSQNKLLNHNFCLALTQRPLQRAARLSSKANRLAMTVETTEPGLQVYAGNNLQANGPTFHTFGYGPNAGIALEPQSWPDAPNHPHFPDSILRPGEVYQQHTRYSFETKTINGSSMKK